LYRSMSLFAVRYVLRGETLIYYPKFHGMEAWNGTTQERRFVVDAIGWVASVPAVSTLTGAKTVFPWCGTGHDSLIFHCRSERKSKHAENRGTGLLMAWTDVDPRTKTNSIVGTTPNISADCWPSQDFSVVLATGHCGEGRNISQCNELEDHTVLHSGAYGRCGAVAASGAADGGVARYGGPKLF